MTKITNLSQEVGRHAATPIRVGPSWSIFVMSAYHLRHQRSIFAATQNIRSIKCIILSGFLLHRPTSL